MNVEEKEEKLFKHKTGKEFKKLRKSCEQLISGSTDKEKAGMHLFMKCYKQATIGCMLLGLSDKEHDNVVCVFIEHIAGIRKSVNKITDGMLGDD